MHVCLSPLEHDAPHKAASPLAGFGTADPTGDSHQTRSHSRLKAELLRRLRLRPSPITNGAADGEPAWPHGPNEEPNGDRHLGTTFGPLPSVRCDPCDQRGACPRDDPWWLTRDDYRQVPGLHDVPVPNSSIATSPAAPNGCPAASQCLSPGRPGRSPRTHRTLSSVPQCSWELRGRAGLDEAPEVFHKRGVEALSRRRTARSTGEWRRGLGVNDSSVLSPTPVWADHSRTAQSVGLDTCQPPCGCIGLAP